MTPSRTWDKPKSAPVILGCSYRCNISIAAAASSKMFFVVLIYSFPHTDWAPIFSSYRFLGFCKEGSGKGQGQASVMERGWGIGRGQEGKKTGRHPRLTAVAVREWDRGLSLLFLYSSL